MWKKYGLLVGLLVSMPAYAQTPPQQPDPAFMQRAIVALQTQRNNALDAQLVAEARLQGVTDELAKANAKLKELEDKKAPEKK